MNGATTLVKGFKSVCPKVDATRVKVATDMSQTDHICINKNTTIVSTDSKEETCKRRCLQRNSCTWKLQCLSEEKETYGCPKGGSTTLSAAFQPDIIIPEFYALGDV